VSTSNGGNRDGRKQADSAGVERPRAVYHVAAATLNRLRAELSRGKQWVKPYDFAKTRDQEIVEKMKRDPVVRKALDLRYHKCASAEWFLEAPDRRSRPLIPYFEQLINRIPAFHTARYALMSAVIEGRAALKMYGPTQEMRLVLEGDEKPRKWWYVGALGPIGADQMHKERRQKVLTDESGERKEKDEWFWSIYDYGVDAPLLVEEQQEEWYCIMLYHNSWNSLGFGDGLQDALYYPFYAKTRIEESLLKHVDRYGSPMIIAKVDGADMSGQIGGIGLDSPEERAADLIAVFEKMRAFNIAVVNKNDDIQLTPSRGEDARGLVMLMDYYDKVMVELILGSGKPTGEGDEGGSYNLAAVQYQVMDDMLSHDLKTSEEALQAIVNLTWKMNLKNFAEMRAPSGEFLITMNPPRIRLRPAGAGPTVDNISRALEMGLPVRRTDAYKALGITEPDGDDVIVQPPGFGPGTNPGAMPGPNGPMVGLDGLPAAGAADEMPGDGVVMSETGRDRKSRRRRVTFAARNDAPIRYRDWLSKTGAPMEQSGVFQATEN